MGWFIIGLALYFLVISAERVLVAVSSHTLEQLRSEASPAAQRAAALAGNVRHALAALLLARVWLKVLLVVLSTGALVQSAMIHALLYDAALRSGLPPVIVWVVSGLLLALTFALVFWLMRKLDLRFLGKAHTAFMLQRLSLFILFWQKLFGWLIRKEKLPEYPAEQTANMIPSANTAASAGEKRDMELLKSIVKFSDVTVKQVMQPRTKVAAVDFRAGFHDLLATVREAGFSRLPVFDEDFDNVTGILYVKDLLEHLDKDDAFEWQSLIRPNVLFVPESKRVSELLQEFKQEKLHMAIVVDEYGGSAGIVTMEDILEEVTGEIRDEFDEESDIRYRRLDEFNYLFEGQTLLNDVCRLSGLAPGTFDEVRGAADTLAGLALELKGDIPKPGAEIAWNGYLLTVVAADSRRIEQLKLTLPRS